MKIKDYQHKSPYCMKVSSDYGLFLLFKTLNYVYLLYKAPYVMLHNPLQQGNDETEVYTEADKVILCLVKTTGYQTECLSSKSQKYNI